MPITISGDGGIAGVTNLDGGDFECATLVASGDTTLGPQAVGRACIFVDDSANSVGINTTTPAAAVFLEVADGTNPIVSLNNTGNGEVRLGCTATAGYIGTESNHPFNIEANSATAVSILANGNIGIGTTAPDQKVVIPGSVGQLKVGSSGAEIEFTRAGGSYITASNAAGSLGFQTGGLNERVTITNDGNVGINTTSPQALLHVVKSNAVEETPVKFRNFFYDGVNNSKTNLRFEMATANNQGGTAVIQGVCGADAGGTNIQNDGGLRILVSSGGSGALSEAATFTKLGNLAFPNGQGIDFSATVGPNPASSVLDDYEEGTFSTAAFNGTITYTGSLTGNYTKIGRVVYFSIGYSNGTFSGATGGIAKITGLPFTANSDSINRSAFFVGYSDVTTNESGGGYVEDATTNIIFYDSGTRTTSTFSNGSAKYLYLSGFYLVN